MPLLTELVMPLGFELHRCHAYGAKRFAAVVEMGCDLINSAIYYWTTILVRLTVFL